ILAVRSNADHALALAPHSITPIDMVVVNLYRFADAAAKPGATMEDLIENIDIGGPAMIRSAAKNYAGVAVVVSPADYPAAISARLEQIDAPSPLPADLNLRAPKLMDLRYGENPHQSAALYGA